MPSDLPFRPRFGLPRDHRVAAVGHPPTADARPIAVSTDAGEHVPLNGRNCWRVARCPRNGNDAGPVGLGGALSDGHGPFVDRSVMGKDRPVLVADLDDCTCLITSTPDVRGRAHAAQVPLCVVASTRYGPL